MPPESARLPSIGESRLGHSYTMCLQQVWALPSLRASPVSTHPCRLLVQRLEFFHQLDRLPPLGMSVVHDRLLIVPNPRGYTPHSLSFIQFHTTPRPSPHDAMPELRPLVGGAQGTGDEAGNVSLDLCFPSPSFLSCKRS